MIKTLFVCAMLLAVAVSFSQKPASISSNKQLIDSIEKIIQQANLRV